MGPSADMWINSENIFHYFKIVDNYYYKQVDINRVSLDEPLASHTLRLGQSGNFCRELKLYGRICIDSL